MQIWIVSSWACEADWEVKLSRQRTKVVAETVEAHASGSETL